MVRKSMSAERMSSITCMTSRFVLAQADHDAGLGEEGRVQLLDLLQQAQRVEVARAGPDGADRAAARSRDCGCRRRAAPRRSPRPRPACAGSRASGSRSWSPGARARIASMQRTNWKAPPSGRSSRSTEVMTTCARPSVRHGLGQMRRLVRVEPAGQAGLDVAEGAGAGAGVAQDHHRRVLLRPALADVRAGRLLADRVQLLVRASAGGSRGIRRDRGLDPIQAGLRWTGLSAVAFPDGGRVDPGKRRDRLLICRAE